jgi:hypothetical protein
MSEAVIEEKCKSTETLEVFVDAVELHSDLEVLGTNEVEGQSVFVLRNHRKSEGQEGAYLEISVAEVIKLIGDERKITSYEKAEEIIAKLILDKPEIVLHGVSRIVGYYSRVTAWNKSKVGELRDRAKGEYWHFQNKKENQTERLNTIDNMR